MQLPLSRRGLAPLYGHVQESGNPHDFPAGIEQIVAGRDAQRDGGNRRVRRRRRVSWRGCLRGSRRWNRRRRACRYGRRRKCRGRRGGRCRRRRVRRRGSSGRRRRIRWHRRGCGCRWRSGTDLNLFRYDNGSILELYPNPYLIFCAIGERQPLRVVAEGIVINIVDGKLAYVFAI